MTDQERAREWMDRTHHQIKDKILWIEGPSFKGIRVSDLLAAYGAECERRGRDEMRQACIDAVDDLLGDTNAISPQSVVKVIEAIHAIRQEGK